MDRTRRNFYQKFKLKELSVQLLTEENIKICDIKKTHINENNEFDFLIPNKPCLKDDIKVCILDKSKVRVRDM